MILKLEHQNGSRKCRDGGEKREHEQGQKRRHATILTRSPIAVEKRACEGERILLDERIGAETS